MLRTLSLFAQTSQPTFNSIELANASKRQGGATLRIGNGLRHRDPHRATAAQGLWFSLFLYRLGMKRLPSPRPAGNWDEAESSQVSL